MNEEHTETPEVCTVNIVRGTTLLQEKWVFYIVHRLLSGPLGFNELSRKVECVNVTTLSQRLSMLEQVGLVTKTVHSTMPPRTSYELTEAGRALKPILEQIEAWSARYLTHLAPQGCDEANS